MKQDDKKEQIYKTIQSFLKNPPVIIWGSGATIPYGMPSMSDLNHAIKAELGDEFDDTADNLEEELGKEKYKARLPNIRKIIWREIMRRDEDVSSVLSSNPNYLNNIYALVHLFSIPHPQCLNIITTNYDGIIEKALGYYDIVFTDGFNRSDFSTFNERLFLDKNIVNIVKVHGSLYWFNIGDEIRFRMGIGSTDTSLTPVIVSPGANKYQETSKIPYRELIQKSDSIIKNAKSILCVGFGFNDEHLTPEITKQIKKGIPLVIITKKLTCFAKNKTSEATKFALLEEFEGKTKIYFQLDKNSARQEVLLDNNVWELPTFLEEIFQNE